METARRSIDDRRAKSTIFAGEAQKRKQLVRLISMRIVKSSRLGREFDHINIRRARDYVGLYGRVKFYKRSAS